ncbi:MAG: flagellar protein FlgN [Syntrophorhabdaceae bacterium]|jgi:flagellar biosynthesis/type III secretory pathway chaperone|nr:flagellar protein FlgN [Syntrophorhabdaceae bacterium]
MDTRILIEIMKKEHETLREFLRVLNEERDSIISFSLEGIIQKNNQKEELVKRLEYLKKEKEKALPDIDQEFFVTSNEWKALSKKIEHIMGEVRTAFEKNIKLLSFSIDHVKSSIEHIVGFINSTVGYGKKKGHASFILSRVV